VDGVWVAKTDAGGPADQAGIEPGDVVLSIDGDTVTDGGEIDEALDGADAGSAVTFLGLHVVSGDPTEFLDPWSRQVQLPGRVRSSREPRSESNESESAVPMTAAISRISSSPIPRVVRAGVPMRRPEGFIGGRSSKGIALRLTVMPTSSRRCSAVLPSRPVG